MTGQRRREEQAERAGRGDQAEREALRVALLEERRQDQAAQRQDGHAGGAGEGGEDGADEGGHHRHAARHPAEDALVGPHQPPRRAPLGQHVAGHGEERDGRQGGGGDQVEGGGRDGGDGRPAPPSRKKSAMATPLMATKTGAPSRKATSVKRSSAVTRPVLGVAQPSPKAAGPRPAPPRRAPARGARRAPAIQTKRSAMTAKPAGMTSWLQATWMPKATSPWLPHSTLTSRTEAQASRAQAAALAAWSKAWPARRRRPVRDDAQRGERQVAIRGRGQQRPQEADPERDVLRQHRGAGQLAPQEAARQRGGGRQRDHRQQEEGDQRRAPGACRSASGPRRARRWGRAGG